MAQTVTPYYHILLDVLNMPVLIVGGGPVAVRKAEGLLECGACVTVVSPQFDPALTKLCAQLRSRKRGKRSMAPTLQLKKRKYRASDVKGPWLVYAATDNSELNKRICDAAHASCTLANCAEPGDAGIFGVPATVRRGVFSIAISTGGASAALSAYWRKRLEKLIGDEWGELAALLLKKREEIKARVIDPAARRKLLTLLGQGHWAAKLKKFGVAEVKRRMDVLIENA